MKNYKCGSKFFTALAGKTLQPASQTEYILAYLGAGNDGSAAKPYTINSIDGWNAFCLAIEDNATWNGFNGKTVVLGTSIGTAENPVIRMSGNENKAFEGTFDGQGNTLTVNIANTDNSLRAAPFSNVSRATVKNLIVAGTITGTMGAGGIMGASAVLLGLAQFHGIEAACIMGETSGYIVDYRSGSKVLDVLERILGTNIDRTEFNDKCQQVDLIADKVKEMEAARDKSNLGYFG